MSIIKRPNILQRGYSRFVNLFREQKGVVGDVLASMFDKGVVRQPKDLNTYRDYYENDSTVGISIDTLSEMVIGNGMYITVDDEETSGAAKEEIEALCEKIRLEENLLNTDKCLNIFGYCPVEKIIQRGGYPPPGGLSGLLLLDPPSMEYIRDVKGGKVTGYQQKTISNPIQFKPEDIVWFTNNQAGNAKGALYGISRIKRVMKLLEVRDQIVQNIGGIMKNQARPPIVWRVKAEQDVATLQTILKEAKEKEQDPVLYPVDGVAFEVTKIDNRAAYWEYVGYIDGLIFQGLHSPMLDYLRNATEASANTMLEVIQRHVEGRQRYYKRMIEHEIFEFHLSRKMPEYIRSGGEIPALRFGAPKNGLEDLEMGGFLTKGLELGYLDTKQFFDILKQKGLTLNTPTSPTEPTGTAPAIKISDGKESPTGAAAVSIRKPAEEVTYEVTRKRTSSA